MSGRRSGWTSWLVVVALSLGGVLPLSAFPTPPGAVTTVALFDPALLETPESLVVDRDGTIFVSLALTGEVRKIAPDGSQETLAFLPIGPPLTPCGSFIGILGALARDDDGNLYASVAACDPADRGVWKISPSGATALLGNLPPTALPNGIALRRGRLYVADSNGLIWTLPASGGTPTVWADHPLLKPAPGAPFPGPNGLQFFRHELYVSNSDQGTVLAFRLRPDGSAGRLRVHATLPDDLGCDDFAFDVLGNLYCTTDPFNRLLRIFPDGRFETLLTAADGLDGPTAAAFGFGRDRFGLYLTNAAFPFFSTTHRPSLLRLRLVLPGVPR
jgi:sugar lactone lactonase YvrE